MIRGHHTPRQVKLVMRWPATATTWLNTRASLVVEVDASVFSYQTQVQDDVVVHVAQQVQPPGTITTAVADVQVAPTLPV